MPLPDSISVTICPLLRLIRRLKPPCLLEQDKRTQGTKTTLTSFSPIIFKSLRLIFCLIKGSRSPLLFLASETKSLSSSVSSSKILTAAPPCLLLLGLILTRIGISTTPVMRAVPILMFLISFSVSGVILSTELLMALTSCGLVTLRIIWVLTCESAFFSTRLGLWLIKHTPKPNFLPSEKICLNIPEHLASP